MSTNAPGPEIIMPKKTFVKIGRPGYKVTKVKQNIPAQDGQEGRTRMGLMFQVHYPQIKDNERPRRRLMSAFEQRREMPNAAYQYLLVSGTHFNITF